MKIQSIPKPKRITRSAIAKKAVFGRGLDRTGWGLSNDAGIGGLFLHMPVQIEKLIPRTLPKRGRPGRILDIGCLHGNTLYDLYRIFGNRALYWGTSLRYNKNWGAIKQKSGNAIQFKVALAETISKRFTRNYFDFIYSNMGIMHAEDVNRAIRQAKRILRKGGLLVISLDAKKPDLTGFKTVKKNVAFTHTYVLQKI